MKTTFRTMLLTVGLAAFGATSAFAATVTFDLTAGNGTASGDSFVFEDSGLTLTTTGHKLERKGATGDDIGIDQTAGGLGIDRGGVDSALVDSLGKDEAIQLSFSETVEITQLTFSNVVGDEFSFNVVDSAGVYLPFLTIDQLTDLNGITYGEFNFAQSFGESSLFTVGADGRNATDNHGFLLETVTVSYTPPSLQAVAAVPLPAGGLLLLTGMGGFAALRRKKHVSA